MVIIGVSSNIDEDKKSNWIYNNYLESIVRAGGTPVILPAYSLISSVSKIYQAFDGFLLSGGPDLDSLTYGEEPHPLLDEVYPLRDAFEIALAQEVCRGNKPLLAICRGCQVLNVALKGNLYQDISPIAKIQHRQKGPINRLCHEVKIEKTSHLSRLCHTDKLMVNSFHHQAIKEIAPELKASAWSSDGIIEAVENKETPLRILGVQWHPERLSAEHEEHQVLFDWLVNASEKTNS